MYVSIVDFSSSAYSKNNLQNQQVSILYAMYRWQHVSTETIQITLLLN